MQAAELFSQKHFSEVVQHEEFMLLSQSEVEKLIKCDEIQVGYTQHVDLKKFWDHTYNCCINKFIADPWQTHESSHWTILKTASHPLIM